MSKAYHRVAVRLNIDWQKRVNDRKAWDRKERRRTDWHDMQPTKTEEEYGLIDQLCKAIEGSL